ncbi:ATP-binding cassette, subfamily C (CFTR/MRP), member 5 [Mytilus galloprovincialis]|uniref:ATP-binding cassette, subfamily C (CFTR/MRP), member 5 n=1 Tax=Mytilus galloprovincialis TaxID=29158 RepID=A0A8B6FGZ4_MYTGA|nr:ATP-binding cassette, subfamily C (CFTR/MRP), member 5 [Mytilus galloprovincialis]
MSDIKKKKSVPELRKFSIFTGLDESVKDKEAHAYDNPALYNGETWNEAELSEYEITQDVTNGFTSGEIQGSRKYSTALKVLKPFRPSSKDGKIPINKAGLLSYMFMTWMTPLVMKMFKNRDEDLKEEDIWECSDYEASKINTDRLEALWKDDGEIKRREQSFISTLLGFIINELIAYLESVDDNILYGIGLVVTMMAANVVRAGTFCVIIMFGAQTGIRFRAGFLGLAYRKLLRLQKIKGKGLAEVINIFGGDAIRVYVNCVTFVYILALPIYMIIGAGYTYYLLGPWCFIAMGIFVLCYILQGVLTKGVEIMRRKTLQHTDKRVRKMTEVLNSMKLLKMYAWEENHLNTQFLHKGEIRKQEKKYLLYAAIMNSISAAVIPVTPTLASVATISTFRAFGNDISASTAFAVVGTLNFLRIIVALIPYATRILGEVRVSFARIKRLLVQEEFKPHSDKCMNQDNAVELDNAFFMWEDASISEMGAKAKAKMEAKNKEKNRQASRGSFNIEKMNFTVQKGQLIGICGPVGSGKSSLMAAILSRMPFISGHVAVNGSIAYAAQQAWIFNDTVRENILFGKSYDPERYQNVIYACGLEPDFAILDDGDETEIGDRGTNLSGGQKQRVSLARAVYSNSDIYLLDDPLSAVDVHVGRHLFHTCIKKTLAGKTVILATHQLQYLKHCDEIVAFEDGGIVERGHHDELLLQNGYYKNMMDKFHYHTNTSMEKQLPIPSQSKKEDADNSKKSTNGVQSEKKSLPKNSSANSVTTNSSANNVTPQKEKGKLTEREEMVVGKVKFGTYKSYINAAGGFMVCLLVMLSYTLTMGSVVFSDWWLGIWINTLNTATINNETNSLNFADSAPSNLTGANLYYTTTPSNNTMNPLPSEESSSGIDFYLLVYASSLGGIVLLTILRGFAGATTTIRASVRLHNIVLKKVMRAPMKFFDSNPSGRILNRFSKDMDEADVFLPQLIDSLMQLLNTIALSLLTTAIVLPWILIAMVPVAILFAILKNISNTSVRQLKRVENVTRSPLLAHVNTTAQGLFTIVPFKQQKQFIESSTKLIDVTSTATFLFESAMRWVGVRLDLSSSMITVATALALVITKGSVAPALAGLSLTMCIKVVGIMQFMVRVMNEVEARFTSIERLHHYEKNLEIEPQTFNTTPSDNWPNEGRIIFSKVEMKYRDNMQPVLRNISFDLHPQMKIGIVGRTGAGKSSLAAALFRLVQLSEGHIYIDGVDVSQIALKVLRSRLSTIPQDPVLFAGTLRYNLDPFGKHPDSELWSSLENVHLKEKVQQFDQDLDYQIEENGENFSVGERQLICLARAILRKNKILLLDEATASIDTQTDSLIQTTIKEGFSDCTVVTIAHRLNTILHSDLIMIMDNGEVIESGTPQDLLTDPHSFFNAMIAAQTVKTPSP